MEGQRVATVRALLTVIGFWGFRRQEPMVNSHDELTVATSYQLRGRKRKGSAGLKPGIFGNPRRRRAALKGGATSCDQALMGKMPVLQHAPAGELPWGRAVTKPAEKKSV